jgi:hypothetical protein
LERGLEKDAQDGKPFCMPSQRSYSLSDCRRTTTAHAQVDFVLNALNLKVAESIAATGSRRQQREVAKAATA